jgi:uncharacterized membrane protein YfcA
LDSGAAIWLYPLIGAASGILAGLFGIGGGLLIVPALVAVFALAGSAVPDALAVHVAIGTSLAVIVVTSVSSIAAHHRRDSVAWPAVWRLVPGILAGGFIGARIADALARNPLQAIFGVLAILLALWMAFGRPPPPEGRRVGPLIWFPVGVVVGTISALVGIGGGVMTVSWLTWQGTPIHRAVGTGAACTLPVALAGAAGFMLTGADVPDLPSGSVGYVYFPAAIGISLASALTAPLGARLAHALPVKQLRRAFAILLAVVGLRMVIGAT